MIAMSLIATAALAQSNGYSPKYRGFVDAGWGAGQYNGPTYLYRQWACEISTTHGVQLSPMVFAGGGVSMFRCLEDKETFLPVYGALRLTSPTVNVHPYAEGRVGIIAHNSEWSGKAKATRFYLAGSLGLDVLSRSTTPDLPFEALQLGGRLALFGLHNDKGAFNATLFLAIAF